MSDRIEKRIEEGVNRQVPGASNSHLEVRVDGAGLDEVLVDLRLIEAADCGPDDSAWRVDALSEQGGAFPWPHRVAVALCDKWDQLRELRLGQPRRDRQVMGGRGGLIFRLRSLLLLRALGGGGGGGGRFPIHRCLLVGQI